MILATVDIDDAASGKLKGFRDALTETGEHVRTFAEAAKGMGTGLSAMDTTRVEANLRATGAALAAQVSQVAALAEAYRNMAAASSMASQAAADLSRSNSGLAQATATQEAATRSATASLSDHTNALERAATGLMTLTGVTEGLATAHANLQQGEAALRQSYAEREAASRSLAEAIITVANAEHVAAEAAAQLAAVQATIANASAARAAADAAVVAATERLTEVGNRAAQAVMDQASAQFALADAQGKLNDSAVKTVELQKAVADAELAVAASTSTVTAVVAEAQAAQADYHAALENRAAVEAQIVESTAGLAQATADAAAAQATAVDASTALRDAEHALALALDEEMTATNTAVDAFGELSTATQTAEELQQMFALSVQRVATSLDQDLLQSVREVAAGFTQLQAQTVPAIEVTTEMAASLQKFATQARDAGLLVGPLDDQMTALVAAFQPGVVVTREMQESLTAMTGAMQQYGEVVPRATEANQANVLSLAAMAAALGAVTVGLQQYLMHAAEQAARGEVLNGIVGVLAETTGNLRGEMMGQIEVVKSLGVTTDAATDSIIKFAQANLSVADASKLARVAQDLGVVANKNSSESFETLTRVIQTQQVVMLRQFGITTTMGTVMREYASEVGKTTKELTMMDRQQAVLNVILKEGAEVTGAYEKSMELAGKQATSLARYQEELADKIGARLMPLYRLWITLQTEVLKYLLDMSPAMTSVVAGVGVLITAITGLAAAMTAARFVGFIDILKAVAVQLGLTATASTAAGAAVGGTATVLGGPVAWAVAALVVGLGLLAAAYTYVVSTTEQAIEKSTQEAAKIGETQARVENYISTIERLKEEKNLTARETEQLADAMGGLYTITGKAVYVFDESTRSIKEVKGALSDYTTKTEAQTRAQIANNDARVKSLEISAQEIRATATSMRTMARTIPSALSLPMNAYAGYLEGRATAMEDAAAKLKATSTILVDAFTTIGKAAKASDERKEAVARIERNFKQEKVTFDEILKTVAAKDRAGRKIAEKLAELDQRAITGKKTGNLTMIPGPDEYKQVFDQITQMYENIVTANEEEAKKAGKRAQKAFQNAFDNIGEQFNLDSPEIRGKIAGLVAEFDKIKGSAAEESRFIDMFGKQVLKLGSQMDFAKRSAEALAAGNKELAHQFQVLGMIAAETTGQAMEDYGNKLSENFAKIGHAMEQALMGDPGEQLQRQTKLDQTSRAAAQKRVELAISTAEEIRKIDEAIYEQDAARTQDALEQQIQAANKGIAEAERATAERLRLMKVEMDEEKRQGLEQVAIAKATGQAKIDEAIFTAETQIRVANMVTEEMTASEAKAADERTQMGLSNLKNFVDRVLIPQREAYVAMVAAEFGVTKEMLDAKQKLYDDTEQALNASLDRQRDANARHVQRMIKDYQLLGQAHKQIWTTLVASVVDAYKGMVEGTMNWKDALLSIWNSILKAVSNIIDQIVERWLSAALRMATAEGGFSAGGFIKGLFGRGAGAAASATGSAVAATAAETAAASTLESGTVGLAGGAAGTAAGGVKIAGVSAGGLLLVGGGAAIAGGTLAHYFADGSAVKGTAYGAAGGAAAGAAIAAPVPGIGPLAGAGIGAIVGGIMGWYVARRQRKQMEEEREEFTEQAGGEQVLRVKAEEAGVTKEKFDKLMDTSSPEEYKKLIDEISKAIRVLEKDQMVMAAGGEEAFRQMAFEAGHFSQEIINGFLAGTLSAQDMQDVLAQMAKDLELLEAKEGLAKTVTQMDQLRKVAVLAGYDLKKLYEAKSIEEFNAQQKILNKLLEEQQLRLEGLNTAAQGLALRVSGLVQSYGKGLEGFVKGLSKEQQDAWKKIAEGTKEGEKSLIQRLRESVDVYKGLGGGARVGDLELTGAQGEELAKILRDVEAQINNISGAALATFGGILRETGNIGQAFEAIGEPLDVLNKLIQETGAQVPQALSHLLSLRTAVQVNRDVVDSLGGITMMLKGLSDAGQLTEGLFNDMGEDAATQWETMKKRGVAEDQALLIMQPTLQALYEAQKNFGFATDESTQALIDMGLAQGLIGDQFQDVNSKMLDMLMIIAEAVGGTVPEAYRAQTEAQKKAAREAAEAAEQQRLAAIAAEVEQQRIADETERTRLQYELLGRTTLGELPLEIGGVADALAPLPAAAEGAAGGMTKIGNVTFGSIEEKIAYLEQAMGVEPGGLANTAGVSKDKLEEINAVKTDDVTGELDGTKDSAYKIVGGAEAATAAIIAMVNNTAGPLDEMSRRIDGISLGHSPGGLKEIKIKSEEGAQAIHEMASAASVDLGKLEDEANGYMLSLDGFIAKLYESANEGTTKTQKVIAAAPMAFEPRYDPYKPFTIEGDPSPAQLITIHAAPIQVHITTLDPSKASEVWRNQIRPEMERDLNTNNRQLGNRVGRAVRASAGNTRGLRR